MRARMMNYALLLVGLLALLMVSGANAFWGD